jgi:hypothetical protein
MNFLLRNSLSFAATAIIAGLSAGSALGQASKVIGEKPAFDDLQSPEFSGGKQKSFKPKNWLEIEAKLKVSLAPEPKSKTCEKLTVRWYVAVKNPDKSRAMFLLSKDVEHVNIPLDEDIFSSIYLSPASLRRLTGSDDGGKSAVELVGYEVLVNGEKKAMETNKQVKGRTDWWNLASESLSRSETVPLLNKMETPFANSWWDRYAEVAVPEK